MNFKPSRFAMSAAFVLIAPILSVPVLADEPGEEGKQTEASSAQVSAEAEASQQNGQSSVATEAPTVAEPSTEGQPAQVEAKEEERICRRIRTDMSSRRATRVCMTREEWREFNSGN